MEEDWACAICCEVILDPICGSCGHDYCKHVSTTHTHTHTHTHAHTHTHILTHTYTHTRTQTHIHSHTHTNTHTLTQAHIHYVLISILIAHFNAVF